jgi:uncharacterized membrane protein
VVVGVVGYIGSGAESLTALLPAVLGVVLVVAGVLAAEERRRMMAMHIAALVALLGIIGSVPRLISSAGAEDTNSWAVVSLSVTTVVLVVFLALAVRSFIEARRARTAS